MGVDLLIFSNHSIKGDSYEERIKNIELKLESNIQSIPNVPYKKIYVPKSTSNIQDVIYYSDQLDGKKHYQLFNEIQFNTNYEWFGGVRIFDKTMLIDPNGFSTDTYKWKQFLGDEYTKKQQSEEYLNYNQKWKEFQIFHNILLTKFGGNQTIFIDDHTFQEPEDLFYQGKMMNEILPELEKVGPILEIENLYDRYEEISEKYKYYGFKLNSN